MDEKLLENFLSQKIEVTETDNRVAVSPGIAKALGLPEMASLGDALRQLISLQEALRPQLYQTIDQEVAGAIAVDPVTDFSKIWPEEKDWAVGLARENGLAVFRKFINRRRPITAAMRRVRDFASDYRKSKTPASLSAVQQSTNAQLGIDEKTFRKYDQSPSADKPQSFAVAQESANRQLGISHEVFAKYSG